MFATIGATSLPAQLPRIETTLRTRYQQIRQFAFDNDPATYFEADAPSTATDTFTLILPAPVDVTRIAVLSGRPDGSHALGSGVLEASPDGGTFRVIAHFSAGAAESPGGRIRALRITPGPQSVALAIREITLDSEPAIARFRYPVEFKLDVSRAPDVQPRVNQAALAWEQAYPLICDELASPKYTPPRVIWITVDPKYDGLAGYSAEGITIAAQFVREQNSHELEAAIIHETAHAVQGYGLQGGPMWLTDGIADYVRFFRWSTGELGHINPDRAHYNGSYRITASFLKYLVDRYDTDIVRKLNRLNREGRYSEAAFRDLTGKSVQVLAAEWHATLPRTPADLAPEAETDVEESAMDTYLPWISRAFLAGAAISLGVLAWRIRRRSPAS